MNSMNSLDTRSVSMLACLWMEGLGALASWSSAAKIQGTADQVFDTNGSFQKGFIIFESIFFQLCRHLVIYFSSFAREMLDIIKHSNNY